MDCNKCTNKHFCQELQHTYFDKRFNKLTIIMAALIVVDLCEFKLYHN